jgi:hypothetical protein
VNDLQTRPSNDLANSGTTVHRESLASFVEFAARAMGVRYSLEAGVASMEFDYREYPHWPKPYLLRMAVEADAIVNLPRRVVSPSEGAAWLWNLARHDRGALLARPAAQPESIHEFSRRLFDAYEVDGGQMHLAGCHLVEVPFVRVTMLAADDESQVEHRLFDAEGSLVDEALIEQLGLADVREFEGQNVSITQREVESLVERIGTSAEDFVAVTIVVAKRAEGAVQFDIGEQCTRVAFNDWTRTLTAPAFHCAASGIATYHLAAIDDGRIVAAEGIVTCDESGARVLDCERVTCGVTGKHVDSHLVVRCPVSGIEVLKEQMTECDACQQLVSRPVLSHGVCTACRELPRAKRSDTWVSGLASEFSALGTYRSFRAGELHGLVRVMAKGWWRKLLIVTRVGETEPLAVSIREGFAGPWQHVPPSDWPSVLAKRDN